MARSRRARGIGLVIGGLFLFLLPLVSLLFPEPAQAQCGASASSCKDCHEVQGKAPVNNDGTGWHQSHAFGDFCVFCHAGNQQATVKDEAHTAMVPPLSDVKAACQSCHPSDLADRVQVYAAILKVTPGSGGLTPTSVAPQATAPAQSGQGGGTTSNAQPTSTVSAPATSVPLPAGLVVDDPNTIDYVQRYEEIVLGKRPVNWGNIALGVMIGLVVLGGGGLVIFNEIKLRGVLLATRRVEGEYPSDVVDMLPAITELKPQSRQSLRNILRHPAKTDKVLGALDSLVSDEKSEE